MSGEGGRYIVEFAKSGRATCKNKKCKQKIEKGVLRIGTEKMVDDHTMTEWRCIECFNLPRKYSSGPGKMTPEEFVCDILVDESPDGSILPEKAGELAEAIASKGKKKKDGDDGAVDGVKLMIQDLKKAYEKHQERDEDEDEPASKKAKTDELARIEAYGTYSHMNADSLKDYLRWNKQVIGGKKDHLLVKVIDGHCNGRIARCPLDGGRLAYKEDGETVRCSGYFDEEMGRHIDCSFRTTIKEAPRWQPWYTSPPTDEENEEMERMIEASKDGGQVDASEDADILAKKAEKITFDLSNKKAIQQTTLDVVKLFKEHSKQLDISDDQKQAVNKVGPILLNHKEMTPSELITQIIKEVGFKEDKEEKAAKKEESMKSVSKNPANAPIAAAFQELASLIQKEGDTFRAGAYRRAMDAINGVEYEITVENAMGLSKGKTKVKDIGKSSAEKIKEFLEHGKIEKLDELRANAS